MDKLGDIDLFVRIVKNNGLAAAGREIGLSPASMTAKLSRLEERYGVRLLNRTTRRIALTEEGKEFYQSCKQILDEVAQAEDRLISGRNSLTGKLRVTATFDLGCHTIAPLVAQFTNMHPNVSVHLDFSDHVVDMLEERFDIAIRYGGVGDNQLNARKLASSSRSLFASPGYIERYGMPETPEDLKDHKSLVILRQSESHALWYFNKEDYKFTHVVQPILASNNGGQIREWALAGFGIALKSYWDVVQDVEANRLVRVLADYNPDMRDNSEKSLADLYAVFSNREFLPPRSIAFVDFLAHHFQKMTHRYEHLK